VYFNFGYLDDFVRDHSAELMLQAVHERLVDEAIGDRQPVRMRVAERLHAVAAWIEGQPPQPRSTRRSEKVAPLLGLH
jgi:hypothetical protein